MKETTYSRAGVFDRPLSNYEMVFRPLLCGKRFREILAAVPGGRLLVLDLMTSGYNLIDFADMAESLAIGMQRSETMTIEELAERRVTYLHADLTNQKAWEVIDQWRRKGQFSLIMARPEGALYDGFWTFDNYWDLLVLPSLERLTPGGYMFFQTPYRVYIGEGDSGNFTEYAKRWRLNTTWKVEEMERLETLVFGLNGCGFEAETGVADISPIPRPYFDLLLKIRKQAT